MDWFETPRPTEVRQYIHEALIFLVSIHAQVTTTSRALLERTLAALIVEIVNEALQCFRQISRFGMGGVLRVRQAFQINVSLMIVKATLEIEFMHQTIVRYVNKPASNTFTEIYTTISKAYQRRPGADGDLQRELDGVKRTLRETRRVTAIEYLCFKAPRKKKGNDTAGAASEASSAA